MNTVQLGIRIPSNLNQHLADFMAQTGMSKTEVVIDALASYIGCIEKIPLAQRIANLEAKVAMLEASARRR